MGSGRRARDWFVRGSELVVDALPAIDFQMHTRWSDGRSSVHEMMKGAQARSLDAIAITEHVNASSAWYPRFVEQVRAERAGYKDLEVYFGAEIAAADYDGGLKTDPAGMETEILVGVVHRFPKRDGNGFWKFDQLTRDDAIELEIAALIGLATNPHISVIGHPGGTAASKYGAFPVDWLEPVFRRASEHDIAVELNSHYLWDLDGLIELLRRVDPLVSFGSDAHEASQVGLNLRLLSKHEAVVIT